jgi:hypothetical protein
MNRSFEDGAGQCSSPWSGDGVDHQPQMAKDLRPSCLDRVLTVSLRNLRIWKGTAVCLSIPEKLREIGQELNDIDVPSNEGCLMRDHYPILSH